MDLRGLLLLVVPPLQSPVVAPVRLHWSCPWKYDPSLPNYDPWFQVRRRTSRWGITGRRPRRRCMRQSLCLALTEGWWDPDLLLLVLSFLYFLFWKNKKKKSFSGISFMGDKKRVVFVYFICQHVPYSVGDARSFTSWGVLQDFFSRVYLSDRRKSMLFWEQASRQALLICVFLFFWEASGLISGHWLFWAKASIL